MYHSKEKNHTEGYGYGEWRRREERRRETVDNRQRNSSEATYLLECEASSIRDEMETIPIYLHGCGDRLFPSGRRKRRLFILRE
jgi:hypothetical protein